jgi:TRAP transporter 4TM/12TM fusion protein
MTSIIAIAMSLFHLYTAAFGVLPAMQQRSIHLTFAILLVVLLHPTKDKIKGLLGPLIDRIIMVLVVIFNAYVFLNEESIALRVGETTQLEIVLGFSALVVLLEATRRTKTWPLAVIALLSISYLFIGHYISGFFMIRKFPVDLIISPMYLTIDGVYGFVTGVSAKLIALFIIFGCFLRNFGLGLFFLNLARSLTGGIKGGPPQVAIIGSCLFGSVSGSAVANVVATGSFTIPMLKRIGYPPAMAGGVEAAASTGGQFMPPVMGAVGFIIAEVLSIPYIHVAYAAFLPGVLYFFAVGISVFLESRSLNLGILPREQRPSLGNVLKEGWYLLFPLATLIYLLTVVKYSPMLSAFYSTVCMVFIDLIVKRDVKGTLARIIEALRDGGKAAAGIAVICACASVVVGIINLTGKGLEITTLLVDLSKGSTIILLLTSMVASIILGMGLPTPACYIFLAVTVIPGLISGGVIPIAAHLFVLYFGMLSVLTPPVCLAVYAASAIAGSPLIPTALKALKYSIVGYIIPFLFVYNPALLMEGTPSAILKSFFWVVALTIILAILLAGHLITRVNILERVLLAISLICFLFMRQTGYQIVGMIVLVIALSRQMTFKVVFQKNLQRLKARRIKE